MPDPVRLRRSLEVLRASRVDVAQETKKCGACGYSLAGLAPGCRCPECGVLSLIHGERSPLGEADPRYLARVALGACLAGAAGIGVAACAIVAIVGALASGHALDVWTTLAPVILGAGAVGGGAGLRLLASVEPRDSGRLKTSLACRVMLGGSGAAVLLTLALAVLWGTGLGERAWAAMGAVAGVGLLCAGFAALPHAASLLSRIPDWRLARQFEDLQLVIPLVAVVGIAVVIGPLLALVVWSLAMLRLGAGVRAAARAG